MDRQTDGRIDGQTDKQIPLCSTGLRPLRGRSPMTPQFIYFGDRHWFYNHLKLLTHMNIKYFTAELHLKVDYILESYILNGQFMLSLVFLSSEHDARRYVCGIGHCPRFHEVGLSLEGNWLLSIIKHHQRQRSRQIVVFSLMITLSLFIWDGKDAE